MKTSSSGKKIKRVVHKKHVIFYSEKYDIQAKADQATKVTKAQELIKNP